ncbi:hypothetical protein BD770DRAFT_406696 [Pilaira anomala]|nr:hypothetical protein BD770DRAFT_406696 [Pilaira anomala]
MKIYFPDPCDRDTFNWIQEINSNRCPEALKHFEKTFKYENEYAELFVFIIYFTDSGCMYFEGDHGIPQNEKSGISWLALAVNNGWSDAMTRLGSIYEDGKLTEKDDKKAMFWFKRVALKDNNKINYLRDEHLSLFGNKKFKPQIITITQDSLRVMFLDHNSDTKAPVL